MLRSLGKTCFAYAYKLALPFGLSSGGHSRQPFIACYHRVVENFDRSARVTIPSMLISTRMLERQLDWLAKHFSLMSLDEIGSQLECGRAFERPVAAVTFDDGYRDVYHHAYPLLQRKGIPSALFVVTGLVDSGRPQIFDRLYLLLYLLKHRQESVKATIIRVLQGAETNAAALKQINSSPDDPFAIMTAMLSLLPQQNVETAIRLLEDELSPDRDLLEEMAPLTWDMLETMHRSGMTIGSHTHSHLLLTAESLATVKTELVESKQILEDRLKAPVRHFGYPDGRYNPGIVAAVYRAGYRFGYGICHARDKQRPLLTIPRKVLWERACRNTFGEFSSAVMTCHADWAFDRKRHCGHDHADRPNEKEFVCVESPAS